MKYSMNNDDYYILKTKLLKPKLFHYPCYNPEKEKGKIDMDNFYIELSASLADVAIRNTVGAVQERIEFAKAKRDDKAIINELTEIINQLQDDKNVAIGIAKTYESEFVAQKLKKEDLDQITNTLLPAIKYVLEMDEDHDEHELDEIINFFEKMLSMEMLEILQSLGFNYKKAIGEPLTNLSATYINSMADKSDGSSIQNKIMLKNAEINQQIISLMSDDKLWNRYLETFYKK